MTDMRSELSHRHLWVVEECGSEWKKLVNKQRAVSSIHCHIPLSLSYRQTIWMQHKTYVMFNFGFLQSTAWYLTESPSSWASGCLLPGAVHCGCCWVHWHVPSAHCVGWARVSEAEVIKSRLGPWKGSCLEGRYKVWEWEEGEDKTREKD